MRVQVGVQNQAEADAVQDQVSGSRALLYDSLPLHMAPCRTPHTHETCHYLSAETGS